MTEQNSKRTITRGAHHIGLTVPNLEQTRGFFLEILGYVVSRRGTGIPGGVPK